MADIRRILNFSLQGTGSILVLLALAVVLLLPALDHHAMERFPLHSHALLSGSAEWHDHYLRAHRHSYERLHSHDHQEQPTASAADLCAQGAEPDMLSTLNLEGIGASLFLRVLLLPVLNMPPPPQQYATLLPRYSLGYSGPSLDLLDPPPRFFC